MTLERGFYGWKLVFILWLVDFLNMGFPLYGGAVINTYMLKEIPMSRSEFGLGFTLLNLFVGIPSILVGASIVRLGIRKTFGIGSALILVGALWLSLIASRPWHYWMGFGVLTATGISFGTIVPAATAITRWFSRYRGRTMAVTLSASGFAGFFVAPLINRILTANGGNWRQAWFMLGFCCYFLGSFLAMRVSPEALWIAFSAAILYGTGFGWTFVCLNTVTGHYYGPAAFPKVNGMMLVLAALFCSPAGYLGGKLFDLYHTYKLAFEVNSAVAAMGIVALFFARMPEAPEARIPVRG